MLRLTAEYPDPRPAPIADVDGPAVSARGWAGVGRRRTIRYRQEDARPWIAAPAVLPVGAHRVQLGPERPDPFHRHGRSDAALLDQREEAHFPLVDGRFGRRFRERAAAGAAAPRRRLERHRRRPGTLVVRVERAHVPEDLFADRQILRRIHAGLPPAIFRDDGCCLLRERVGVGDFDFVQNLIGRADLRRVDPLELRPQVAHGRVVGWRDCRGRLVDHRREERELRCIRERTRVGAVLGAHVPEVGAVCHEVVGNAECRLRPLDLTETALGQHDRLERDVLRDLDEESHRPHAVGRHGRHREGERLVRADLRAVWRLHDLGLLNDDARYRAGDRWTERIRAPLERARRSGDRYGKRHGEETGDTDRPGDHDLKPTLFSEPGRRMTNETA